LTSGFRRLRGSLFPSRLSESPHLSTRQYSRIVGSWVGSIGLDPAAYGTHSMRRTKPTLIYRRTRNLRAVQLFRGHSIARAAPIAQAENLRCFISGFIGSPFVCSGQLCLYGFRVTRHVQKWRQRRQIEELRKNIEAAGMLYGFRITPPGTTGQIEETYSLVRRLPCAVNRKQTPILSHRGRNRRDSGIRP
jgi:hypothetical protein